MRLTKKQIQEIRRLAQQIMGKNPRIRLFGSRLDNTAQGGDIDLMLEFSKPIENPALIAAQLSAKISRVMDGRKVDVILMAPNLMLLPIHEVALKEGVLL